ncbi:MAG: family 16 glycosylhydrolase [Fibrobacteria bacterium]|nr:family 16 glycosylhydrolase [Fibrobacteria bacterium]
MKFRFVVLGSALLSGCGSIATPQRVAGGTSSTGNSLAVRVVDANGSPAVGDSVLVRPDSLVPSIASTRAVKTDAEGMARFTDLADGSWVVEARGDSTGRILRLGLAGEEAPFLDLKMGTYGTLSGTVVLPDGDVPGTAFLRGTGQTAKTGDSGTFEFHRVSPGEQIAVALPNPDGSLGVATWEPGEVKPGAKLVLPARVPILPRNEAWRLVWTDEFEGFDRVTWGFDTGDGCPELCAWGNGSLQSFDSSHVLLRDGALVLRAERTSEGWRSGSVQSRGRREFQEGRFEFRARFPSVPGAWALISLQGDSTAGPVWPDGGAIDVAGLWGHRPEALMGIAHLGDSSGESLHPGTELVDSAGWADRWVEFAVEWSPAGIVWIADDRVFHRIAGGRPFDHPFYLSLRLGVGGDGNVAPDSLQEPFEMLVDRVRIFRRP